TRDRLDAHLDERHHGECGQQLSAERFGKTAVKLRLFGRLPACLCELIRRRCAALDPGRDPRPQPLLLLELWRDLGYCRASLSDRGVMGLSRESVRTTKPHLR